MGKIRLVAALAASLACGATIAGCSGPVDCAYPTAAVPATAAPGDSITLRVKGLYRACQAEEQRLGDVVTLGEVTVTLRSDDGQIYASSTAPFGDDAQATVVLKVPATASGSYDVLADSDQLGVVEIAPQAG